jgi:hypothetical protein
LANGKPPTEMDEGFLKVVAEKLNLRIIII